MYHSAIGDLLPDKGYELLVWSFRSALRSTRFRPPLRASQDLDAKLSRFFFIYDDGRVELSGVFVTTGLKLKKDFFRSLIWGSFWPSVRVA
jgi:hypothetical protein